MKGKTVILTGGTEGIGKAAALALARQGAHLALVGRNKEKTARVVDEIVRATGATVTPFVADLSRLVGVRELAAALKGSYDRIDVLVNNAGALFSSYELTPDGFEQTFALNHLGYFHLSVLLLDVLRATPGSRVVSTASAAHRVGRLDLADVARRERTHKAGFRAYGDSKLANILFTRALARRLGPGHLAVCYHPGFVHSGFGGTGFRLLARLVARTPEQGADTLVWLATAPAAELQDGAYYADRAVARTTPLGADDRLAEGLWDLSTRLTGVPQVAASPA